LDAPAEKKPGARPTLQLVRLIGRDGPYEVWQATEQGESGGSPIALRRAAPDCADRARFKKTLELATAIARRVAHLNVLSCHGLIELEGETAQVMEHAHELHLGTILEVSRAAPEAIEPKLALWIARQMLEAIVHAESLGCVHGHISPRHVYLTREGIIKIDYGITRPPPSVGEETALAGLGDAAYQLPIATSDRPPAARSEDAYSAACLLWEMLAGETYASAIKKSSGKYVAPSAIRPSLPESLDQTMQRALDPDAEDPILEAKALAQLLTRAFYVDLDADDVQDGQHAIRRWLTRLLPDLSAVSDPLDPRAITEPNEERPKGLFTRMLEERAAPVAPKPLTADDHDSAIVGPDSTWTPGRTIAHQGVSTPLEVESERKTEALPDAATVPPPEPLIAPPNPSPEDPPSTKSASAQSAPDSAPSASVSDPPSVSGTSKRSRAFELLIYALFGFALTFFLIIAYTLADAD
jgi:serine/threonine protein kinase